MALMTIIKRSREKLKIEKANKKMKIMQIIKLEHRKGNPGGIHYTSTQVRC